MSQSHGSCERGAAWESSRHPELELEINLRLFPLFFRNTSCSDCGPPSSANSLFLPRRFPGWALGNERCLCLVIKKDFTAESMNSERERIASTLSSHQTFIYYIYFAHMLFQGRVLREEGLCAK